MGKNIKPSFSPKQFMGSRNSGKLSDIGSSYSIDEEAEIERLRQEIAIEEKLLAELEQNYNQILDSSKGLEKCLNFVDEESNEWKTRYENQLDINQQYSSQQKVVENNLNDVKQRFKVCKYYYIWLYLEFFFVLSEFCYFVLKLRKTKKLIKRV